MNMISPVTAATGKLFALVALADGDVRDIENSTAEAVIECINGEEADAGKFIYENALVNIHNEKVEDILKIFIKMDRPAQFELLRACWYIALCDKDLDIREEELIYSLGDAMGISRCDSLLAQKSAA